MSTCNCNVDTNIPAGASWHVVQQHQKCKLPVQYFTSCHDMYKFIVETMPHLHVCTNEYWHTAYLESVKKLSLQLTPISTYCMSTNFRGWLNFAGTSQSAKNNTGKIFVRLRPHKNMHCWARQAREWCSFITFIQPLKRNSMCCFPLPSLVHWSTNTIAQLMINPEKSVVITPITNPQKLKI